MAGERPPLAPALRLRGGGRLSARKPPTTISITCTTDSVGLHRRIAALLDDLIQSPPLSPLSLPLGDMGREENSGQDGDEVDRESWLGVHQSRPSVDRMNRMHIEGSRPISNAAFVHSSIHYRRSELNNLLSAGSVIDASRTAGAMRRESIESTQRFAAVSTSVSQGQSHAVMSSGSSRLLRRAPVRSEYVIEEEQNFSDPPPRPHLPTLAALLRSDSDMGRLNGELYGTIILNADFLIVLLLRRPRPTSSNG